MHSLEHLHAAKNLCPFQIRRSTIFLTDKSIVFQVTCSQDMLLKLVISQMDRYQQIFYFATFGTFTIYQYKKNMFLVDSKAIIGCETMHHQSLLYLKQPVANSYIYHRLLKKNLQHYRRQVLSMPFFAGVLLFIILGGQAIQIGPAGRSRLG